MADRAASPPEAIVDAKGSAVPFGGDVWVREFTAPLCHAPAVDPERIGCHGKCLISGWFRVIRDFEVIHLSVLRCPGLAGEGLEVGDGFAKLLADWNPDETCWVNGLARLTARTESWHQ